MARSSQNQKGQQQLCGNTDSPARGLNSTLPPCSWRTGNILFYFYNTFIVTTQNITELKQTPENTTPRFGRINLTPCTNKPQKLMHIRNKAALLIRHKREERRESRRQKACVIIVVGPLRDHWPIISLLLDDSPQRICGLIL